MNYPRKSQEGFTLVEIIIVVVIIGLLAALAVPAWQKIRLLTIINVMDNDARQLGGAAQQYFMEYGVTSVAVGYVWGSGAITGPLADRVHFVGAHYTSVSTPLTEDGGFTMAHEGLPAARSYNAEGHYQP